MKYAYALIAIAAVMFLWSLLSVAIGWKHGGGVIPLLFLMAIIGAIWKTITSKFNDAPLPKKENDLTLKSPSSEKKYYAQAFEECSTNSNSRDSGLWALAFSLSNGDESRTKAKYIELRVSELANNENNRNSSINSRSPAQPAINSKTVTSTPTYSCSRDHAKSSEGFIQLIMGIVCSIVALVGLIRLITNSYTGPAIAGIGGIILFGVGGAILLKVGKSNLDKSGY